jgi:hypothetical protein
LYIIFPRLRLFVSFIFKVNNDPRWARFKNDDKWVTKLPFTTGSSHGKYAKPSRKGKAGILKSIREFTNNVRVFGYYDEVVVQPMAHYNKEAKVFVFAGEAQFRNPHKDGWIKQSVFGHAPDSVFLKFAEDVVKKLRENFPEFIVNQGLRIDFFGDLTESGELFFIVNEIEGFEARQWGTGVNAADKIGSMKTQEQNHWKYEIETLIECHLELNKQKYSK